MASASITDKTSLPSHFQEIQQRLLSFHGNQIPPKTISKIEDILADWLSQQPPSTRASSRKFADRLREHLQFFKTCTTAILFPKHLTSLIAEFVISNPPSRTIASGGTATISLLHLNSTPYIKKNPLPSVDGQKHAESLRNEALILLSLSHPHVIQLLAIEFADQVPKSLLLPFCEHKDLWDFCHSEVVDPHLKGLVASQIADGLCFIHAKRVIHRDIKPENVLVQGSKQAPTIVISDFGFASSLPVGEDSVYTRINGTYDYLPPETHQALKGASNHENVDPSRDVWAYGCTLVFLFNSSLSYKSFGNQILKYYHSSLNLSQFFSKPDISDKIFSFIDNRAASDPIIIALKEIAKTTLSLNPKHRPSMEELCKRFTEMNLS